MEADTLPKNDPPCFPMTPTFYLKILLYYKNQDVFKKIDTKIYFLMMIYYFAKNIISLYQGARYHKVTAVKDYMV